MPSCTPPTPIHSADAKRFETHIQVLFYEDGVLAHDIQYPLDGAHLGLDIDHWVVHLLDPAR